jgi:hypothetical protein
MTFIVMFTRIVQYIVRVTRSKNLLLKTKRKREELSVSSLEINTDRYQL